MIPPGVFPPVAYVPRRCLTGAAGGEVASVAVMILRQGSIMFLKQGSIKGETIDKKKLIDQHYFAIASKATFLKP